MLGKLMKYELKATARWFLPLYCGIIIFAIFSKISTTVINLEEIKHLSSDNLFIQMIVNTAMLVSAFLYGFIIITTIVMTFVIAIRRFYKNLLSDEGYLMFTLPVSSHKLLLSKFLTTMIWYVCSIVVIMISLFILFISKEFFGALLIFPEAISQLLDEFAKVPSLMLFLILTLIDSFISFPFLILMIYVSIAIGHTRHNHKVLYSFGTFLGLNIIISIISNIISFIFFLPYTNLFSFSVNGYTFDNTPINPADNLSVIDATFNTLNGLLIFSFIFSIALSVAFYFVTNYILSKKLNLE